MANYKNLGMALMFVGVLLAGLIVLVPATVGDIASFDVFGVTGESLAGVAAVIGGVMGLSKVNFNKLL